MARNDTRAGASPAGGASLRVVFRLERVRVGVHLDLREGDGLADGGAHALGEAVRGGERQRAVECHRQVDEAEAPCAAGL